MKSRGTRMKMMMLLLAICIQFSQGQNSLSSDPWQQERPPNMPQILNLEVMCAKDHMEVQLAFDKPFNGLVFSKGQFGHDNCVYVHPKSGKSHFRFSIVYNGCGTKPDMNGKFYENTVVVQYDEELIEVWDEAKRLRCEWYNDYEKTASKPPMVIADLEVVELNFRGDNVDCWMEIQNGKGPWASPITGIVPLGSTLTMVVAINDHAGEFDMRVKSCEASDGVNRPIQLSDENGCVLRPKMVSKFLKLRSNDGRSTVMSYAFFHAFKFPDSLQVYIRCKVEICRFGCPEHCDKSLGSPRPVAYASETQASYSQAAPQVVQPAPQIVQPAPQPPPQAPYPVQQNPPAVAPIPQQQLPAIAQPQPPALPEQPSQYPQRRVTGQQSTAPKRPFFSIGGRNPPSGKLHPPRPGLFQKKKDTVAPPLPQPQAQVVAIPIPIPGSQTLNTISQEPVVAVVSIPQSAQVQQQPAAVVPAPVPAPPPPAADPSSTYAERSESAQSPQAVSNRFPYGPRKLNLDKEIKFEDVEKYAAKSDSKDSKVRRKRYVFHERHVRSADIGVRTGYEVISAVDLAFTPNASTDGVTIFQGKIREEVVYGICLPAPGFSALFVLLAMCVVISVLVASFLCYHRQLQKADREGACVAVGPPAHPMMGVSPAVPFRDWSMVHFLRNPKAVGAQ